MYLLIFVLNQQILNSFGNIMMDYSPTISSYRFSLKAFYEIGNVFYFYGNREIVYLFKVNIQGNILPFKLDLFSDVF